MTKLSVVSTVFNGEQYFDRSVPSILGQSLHDFEWVIVDDGSTDRTPELLARLEARDSRVKVYSPGRLGRAMALNMAAERARGEYIANQDFDDISYPDRLRLQVAFLDSRSEVGLVGGHYLVMNENRGERFRRTPREEHQALIAAMAKGIPFAHTVSMFRKQAWYEVGGYPEVDNLVDFRFWIALARAGWRIGCLPELLGVHFVHADSYWHRNFEYRARQRDLARAQSQAIRTLGLPFWTRIYPAGRRLYWSLPNVFKKVVRRALAGTQEKDI